MSSLNAIQIRDIPRDELFGLCQAKAFELYKAKGPEYVWEVFDRVWPKNSKLPMIDRKKLADLKNESLQRLFLQVAK
jgi:hypothetical protein